MKTILIIGDSWGVPGAGRLWPDGDEQNHTHFQLQRLGYNVINFSMNGCSMLRTIEYARHAVLNKPLSEQEQKDIKFQRRDMYSIEEPKYKKEKIHGIIWFHSESIREIYQPIIYPWITFGEIHRFNIRAAYRAFADLVKICKNPITAVIGGQAPVDRYLYEFIKPDFVIEDWRSEIVGRKLPWCHSLTHPDIIDSLYMSTQEKLSVLNTHKELLDAMDPSEFFFDGCHAGTPHIELSAKLHELFKNS